MQTTMTIKGTRDDISEIVDIAENHNMFCEDGQEVDGILVDSNNLTYTGSIHAVADLQETIENYEYDAAEIVVS